MRTKCPRCGEIIEIGEVETFRTQVLIANEVKQYRDEGIIRSHVKYRLANNLSEFLIEKIACSEYQDTLLNGTIFEARIKVVMDEGREEEK